MRCKFGEIFPHLIFKDLEEDEYFNEEGYPYCKKCKTPRYFKIDVGGGEVEIMHARCQCQQKEIDEQRAKEEAIKNLEAFRRRQQISTLGKKYLDARFETAVITKSNKEAYTKCKNYAAHSREVLNDAIGLYIYGDNSSGKSYLLACLCNELVRQGYFCVYTSVPRMIAEIQQSYSDDSAMGQAKLVSMLENKAFVFIDDLGKEFLGREGNTGAAKFAEKLLLEVLNARYNNGKPTIFSSNYSIAELAEVFKLDKAIIERVNEMSTRVIKLEGDDFRDAVRKEKNELAKKLGI